MDKFLALKLCLQIALLTVLQGETRAGPCWDFDLRYRADHNEQPHDFDLHGAFKTFGTEQLRIRVITQLLSRKHTATEAYRVFAALFWIYLHVDRYLVANIFFMYLMLYMYTLFCILVHCLWHIKCNNMTSRCCHAMLLTMPRTN